MQELWEKWVFIASRWPAPLASMRALIGDVERAGAADLALGIFAERAAGDRRIVQGYAPRAAAVERGRRMVTTPGSTLTASMMKDIERGAPIEGEEIIGDLLTRGRAAGVETPLLRVVHAHLRSYEARRARARRRHDVHLTFTRLGSRKSLRLRFTTAS